MASCARPMRVLVATAALFLSACSAETADGPPDPISDPATPGAAAVSASAAEQASEPRAPATTLSTPTPSTVTERAPTPGDSPSRPAPPPPSDWSAVLDRVTELRGTPTARAWAAGNPERLASLELNDVDSRYPDPPIFGVSPTWCLRSIQVDSAPSGATRERYSFFYRESTIPSRPNDGALPEFSPGIEHQLSDCTLRMVATEISGTDSLAVLDQWRRAHDLAFGGGANVDDARLPYGLRRNGLSTWADGDLVVAAGMAVTGNPVALAALPLPGSEPYPAGHRYSGTRAWRTELLDLALAAVELPPETRARIETLRLGTLQRPPATELVLGVLSELIERPARIAPDDPATERYAEGLGLADLLLSLHYSYIPPSEDRDAVLAAVARFNALGADFERSEGDATYVYSGALADSARALPSSRIGWNTISSLEEGCSWDATLEATAEGLPIVTHPRILARLHYLRAEALVSILSAQRTKSLRPGVVLDVEELRREAFDHYRAALAGGLTSEDEAWAWSMAWSVAMNEPVYGRYGCFTA